MASRSNEISSATDELLSLQDLCKLIILCNINEFTVEVLSLLPQSIKRPLFKVATLFDRLHFDNSSDFCQEFGIEDLCPPSEEECNSDAMPRTARVLYGDSNNMIDTLVKCLFTNPRYSPNQVTEYAFKEGCCLNLSEAANFLDCLSTCDDSHLEGLIQHIFCSSSYTVVVLPPRYYTSWSIDNGHATATENLFKKYLIVPRHITEFLSVECTFELIFSVINIKAFIAYCNLKPSPSTKVFSICTIQLLGSPIWKEYVAIRDNSITRIRSPVNPIYPFLQNVLAPVEHLNIGTYEGFEPSDMDEEDFSIDAPFFILHNILSQEQPNLKSIHVHGIANTVIETVQTVSAFLVGKDNSHVAGIMNDRYSESGHMYYLTPPVSPYFIEKLEITAKSGDMTFVKQYMTEYSSSVISNTVKGIIEVQKSSLKCLALKGLGFTYKGLETSSECLQTSSLCIRDLEIVNSDAYCSLLQSTLPDFVQLPQFESLTLSESPDEECYHLLMAFLSTPASHDQNLTIMLKPSKTAILDWYKRYNVPTNLPESNIQFKSLNLKGEKSQLVKFVLSFPNLSLKSLNISSHHLSLAEKKVLPTTVNIQCFSFHIEAHYIINDSKLDVFISENQSLTSLTMFQDNSETYPSLLSTLNKCLQRMVNKKSQLDFIILRGIDLNHFLSIGLPPSSLLPMDDVGSSGLFTSSDEQGYDFTKWPSNLKVMKDVISIFSSIQNRRTRMNSDSTSSTSDDQSDHHIDDNIPSYVNSKDTLFSFFLLVQKLNATLTIDIGRDHVNADSLQQNLVRPLEKAQIRLKKIILKLGNIKQCKEKFDRIAEVVSVVDDSTSFTNDF